MHINKLNVVLTINMDFKMTAIILCQKNKKVVSKIGTTKTNLILNNKDEIMVKIMGIELQ